MKPVHPGLLYTPIWTGRYLSEWWRGGAERTALGRRREDMRARALRRLILRDCFGIIKAGLVDPANAFAPEASEGKNS